MTTRIGVLVPAGNPTVEPELYRMAPAAVTLHFARIDATGGTPGAHEGMEQRLLGYIDSFPVAVPPLAAVRPKVLVLAHTALSYAVGFAHEPAIIDRLTKLAGCAVVTASRAILAALAHLGVTRIALAVPYTAAIETLGATYWKAAGLDVVTHHRLEGVENIYDETEARAYALGRATDTPAAEALLISGTGLPTAGIIQRLENDIGKPVVTGQSAALWHAMRVAGVDARVVGYGRLLSGTRGN
jgi:maleate isomerase